MRKIEEDCRDRCRKFFETKLQESWEHVSRAETAGCPTGKSVNLCLEGGEEAMTGLEQAVADGKRLQEQDEGDWRLVEIAGNKGN